MKRMIGLLAALVLVMVPFGALADGMGVQIIGGDDLASETASLDDLQIGVAAEAESWGTVTITDCRFQDVLYQYKEGKHEVAGNWNCFNSGNEADYLIVKLDILNNTKAERDYLSNIEVKAVFMDDVEFAGWSYQYNWDNGIKDKEWEDLNGIQNKEFVIDPADQFAIMPYYIGHYCFGCTLPNTVVTSKEPLRLEVKIDGNELTYNVR